MLDDEEISRFIKSFDGHEDLEENAGTEVIAEGNVTSTESRHDQKDVKRKKKRKKSKCQEKNNEYCKKKKVKKYKGMPCHYACNDMQ